MTPEKPPANENDALEKRIGAIENEVANVRVVVRRAGRTRLLMLLAALLLIGIAVWMFYGLARQFGSQENLNLLAQKAQARAQESSGPAMRHVQGLVDNSVPVLREAFRKQVEKDMPRYQAALDKEGQILAKNLETKLNEKIKTHYEEASKKYQEILREEFPDLEDPELLDKMYSSVVDILERFAEEYYSEKIQAEIDSMNQKWIQFEMAEVPKEGDPSLEQQFMASLLYLAALKIDEKSVE